MRFFVGLAICLIACFSIANAEHAGGDSGLWRDKNIHSQMYNNTLGADAVQSERFFEERKKYQQKTKSQHKKSLEEQYPMYYEKNKAESTDADNSNAK